jgi:hypothetical protein
MKNYILTTCPNFGVHHNLHMFPFTDLLFPSAYLSEYIHLSGKKEDNNLNEFEVTIRVFNDDGPRDYNLKLQRENPVNSIPV